MFLELGVCISECFSLAEDMFVLIGTASMVYLKPNESLHPTRMPAEGVLNYVLTPPLYGWMESNVDDVGCGLPM